MADKQGEWVPSLPALMLPWEPRELETCMQLLLWMGMSRFFQILVRIFLDRIDAARTAHENIMPFERDLFGHTHRSQRLLSHRADLLLVSDFLIFL